jgi:hypothetical protein
VSNVISFRNETVVDPTPEQLAQLEDRARGYFRNAFSSAFEELLKDAARNKLGSISIDTIAKMVRRVIDEETAHMPEP